MIQCFDSSTHKHNGITSGTRLNQLNDRFLLSFRKKQTTMMASTENQTTAITIKVGVIVRGVYRLNMSAALIASKKYQMNLYSNLDKW